MEAQQQIISRLEKVYVGSKPALEFTNPFELLVATILSAQCTDERVNKVTRVLFKEYPNPQTMASGDIGNIKEIIRSCGCYEVKSKSLKGTACAIVETHGGQVPKEMEALVKLPGVGRKTASVVLSNAFGIPAFAVDTHVLRVSNRLGLANSPKDVLKTEIAVCELIPKEKWSDAHHWLIYHGRRICHARKPECSTCFLRDLCPSNTEEI